MKIQKYANIKWKIILICGCWPPSGPPAAKNQVFLILMWMLAPSKASGGNKSSISFLIFPLLLNAFWHAETIDLVKIIAKSGFKNEKLALCVELLPKHTPQKNLVPMLYIKFFFKPLSKLFVSFFCAYHSPKESTLKPMCQQHKI